MAKFIWIFFTLSLCALAGTVAYNVYPEEIKSLIAKADFINSDSNPEQSETATGKKSEMTPTPLPSAVQELKPQPPEDLKNAEALLERGQNFLEAGFISLAINDFFKASDLNSNNREVWGKLIKAQIALRDYGAAEVTAQKALQKFPDEPEYLILLGETQIQKSEFTQAKETFAKLPDSPAKSFYLGTMNVYFEDMEAAKTLLKQAKDDKEFGNRATIFLAAFEEFSLFPGGSPLHLKLLLSKAMNDLNFYEMAIQKAKSILKDREDYRDAWLILGHSYLSLGRSDLAKNVLERALELDPTKAETTFFLGQAESALGNYEDAITHLTMSQENGFEPKNEVTKALAEAYLEAKYYEASRVEYEKLIEQDSKSAAAYVEPVRISIELLNDTAAAKLLAEKAVQNDPDSPVAQNLLGWALLENGDLGAAKDVLNKIIAEKPDYAAAYLNLGKIAEKESDTEQAVANYRKAYDLAPHSEIGAKAAERYNVIVLADEE